MSIAAVDVAAQTLAEALRAIGDVPLERIRFPVGNATEEDVVRWLDGRDKHICELVDGVLVEKAMGYRESLLAAYIGRKLDEFAEEQNLGIVTGADGPYRLRPGRIRFPDTGFVSWDQFPSGELPPDAICDAVPELVVEVISEGNTSREMELKLRDYFWFIRPERISIYAGLGF